MMEDREVLEWLSPMYSCYKTHSLEKQIIKKTQQCQWQHWKNSRYLTLIKLYWTTALKFRTKRDAKLCGFTVDMWNPATWWLSCIITPNQTYSHCGNLSVLTYLYFEHLDKGLAGWSRWSSCIIISMHQMTIWKLDNVKELDHSDEPTKNFYPGFCYLWAARLAVYPHLQSLCQVSNVQLFLEVKVTILHYKTTLLQAKQQNIELL